MKKTIAIVMVLCLVCFSAFAGGAKEDAAAPAAGALKVGMVTDAGTIDDKSFNQGTWEGIVRAGKDLGVDTHYLRPAGETEADYLQSIGDLVDAGYQFIVCPGFNFETAIFVAQDRWPNIDFVILDGEPHTADYSEFRIEKNVVGVYWAEQESGFLAGVAAAIELKSGSFGFVGGMELPAVQKFNWGFQQGVAYANATYGTSVKIDAENVIYQGTFTDVAAGQQLAATMYDKGVNLVFAAAGGVGIGVINEAKNRAQSGQDVWVIGVDVDQYAEGLLPSGKSVVMTSAMKYLDRASYDMIQAKLNGAFPGGTTLRLNASNDGIGIPVENPNLSAATMAEVNKVYDLLKNGTVKVADVADGLIK